MITGVNGKEIATPQQLQDVLRASKPGDRLTMAFTRRDGPEDDSRDFEERSRTSISPRLRRRVVRRRPSRRPSASAGSVRSRPSGDGMGGGQLGKERQTLEATNFRNGARRKETRGDHISGIGLIIVTRSSDAARVRGLADTGETKPDDRRGSARATPARRSR